MKTSIALSGMVCLALCQTAVSGTAWRVDGQVSSPPGAHSDGYAITHCAVGDSMERALWIPNQYGDADGGLDCEISNTTTISESAYAVDVVCTGVGGFLMIGNGVITVNDDSLEGRIELGAARADMRVRHEWTAQTVGGCD